MRLLAVADLHYSLPQFDWVLEVAPDFDVVVLAGDLLELSSIVDRRAQAVVIRKYFERLRAVTRLVICSGNHDLDSPQESGEKVAKWLAASPDDGIITDGESLQIDGILITVCPWWDGPITRAGIAAQLGEAARTERKLWIWIHHAPPDKSPTSWGGTRYFGDTELVQWIVEYKPDIVLSGHVHQSPFVKDGSWVDRIGPTWVFNAGQQFGAPPTHIIIDTEVGEALWFSSAGNQYIRFSEPLERPVPRLEGIPDWLKAEDRPPPPGRM
jgi:Icc-related predicted phosphoesterase